LKGRGFKPRRKSFEMNIGFSRWGNADIGRVFQQTGSGKDLTERTL